MNKQYDQQTAARLMANIHRKKRPDNLVKIAGYIRRLESDVGSLKAVSEIPEVDISTDMLRQFLSIERLCPEVQRLVEERKIDRINIVHYMRNFDPTAQQIIAKEVIAEQLSANDIRVLAPLRRAFPQKPAEQLISHVQNSRDVKSYIAYFQVPAEIEDAQALRKRFEQIVGETEIMSYTVEDCVGMLELTSVGHKRIREEAKNSKLSLRKLFDNIVQEQTIEGE